ncbi:MAG: hypothetical protein QME68_06575, partial [Elusimicrobiota bacterium]|nr:hypothetical protein [Elusimicrobiota bacterium]
YLLSGKINKKSETLYTVSTFLRDGKTGDIKCAEFDKFKSSDELKSTAKNIVNKIIKRIK